MKKILIVLITCSLLFFSYNSYCQYQSELWGMTQTGGDGGGVLFKTEGNGLNQQILTTFIESPGRSPIHGHLCQAANGKFYGMTQQAGTSNLGVLFEYDPATSVYIKKVDFLGTSNGSSPRGSLVQAANGKLYGMTYQGGASNYGVLFEYDPATSTYTKKIDFAGATNGRYPYGSLMLAANGKLYGMTNQGGTSGFGVMFEFDPTTSTYTKKIDFTGATNGSYPCGDMMQASSGKLYGMTYQGGTSGNGVLFEYDYTTSTYTKKIDFAGATNGRYPYGSLIQISGGKMYGLTAYGGTNGYGVLFEYDPATSVSTKKLDFAGTTNGSYPYGSLAQASNGKLYGMTQSGGTGNYGVLFEYDPSTSTFTKKLDFAGATNGSYPQGSMIKATDNKLYGMTTSGGTSDFGTMFEFDALTSVYLKRFDFSGTNNGSNPYGSLMQADNWKLYGMTYSGGSNNFGVLFEFDPVNLTYTKKIDFAGTTNGKYPYGSLTKALNGKLYGMTYQGGSANFGVLFEFDPLTSAYTKKIDFVGTSNGRAPYGSLTLASSGKLYGMTYNGGTSNNGVLFEFDPSTSAYVKKVDFTGTANGSYPFGSLIQASNGKLYGMTYSGGTNGMGVLFEFDPVTSTYTNKFNFDGTANGSYPYGSLVQASDGKLYGMTYQGGASGFGVMFTFDPATSSLTKKFDFTGTSNGSYPRGNFIQASNGKLYGMTYRGGISDLGVLFEYDPITSTYIKKIDFISSNGSYPYYSNVIEVCINPEFTALISDATICTGGNTNFITAATGNDLTYQWQVNDGSGFTDIFNGSIYSDVTDDSLHITGALSGMNNYQYRCVVTSACPAKSIFSDTATLFLYPDYNFTDNHSICSGDVYNWRGSDYSAAGTYTEEYLTTHGCDSVFTLNLTVNYNSTGSFSMTECDSYTAPDGVVYTTSGIKTAVIPNAAGCDSTITINLAIIHSTTSSISVTDCDSYTAPDGIIHTTSGIKTAVIPNAAGCDSTITINLTIKHSTTSSVTETACDSYTAPDGIIYTSSGIKTAVIPNLVGCDSTITINLTLNHSTVSSIAVSDCISYTAPDGVVYTTSGIKTAVIPNAAGCDSTITINLTINQNTTGSVTETECDSYTAPDGTAYTTSGIYTAVIPNSAGCDSTITIDLTIIQSTISSITETACDSYTAPDGNVFTTSGIQTAVIPNSLGCDSTITIDLTINYSSTSSITESACDSYTAADGVIYSSSGTYTAVISNTTGCDSTITIDLTIYTVDATVTVNDPSIYANASGAIYQWVDCDNNYAPIPGEYDQAFTADTNGNYAVIVTLNSCTDTSLCNQVTSIGFLENTFNTEIILFPNPTKGLINIDMGTKYENIAITISDLNGREIKNESVKNRQVFSIYFDEPAGVYLITITSDKENARIKLIRD